MSPRWNWDFEDGERATRRRSASPLRRIRAPLQPSGDARFRRRRLGAALAFALLVIVLVIVLSGSHHGGGASSSAGTSAHAARSASLRAVPPADALERGDKAVDSVLGYTPFARAGGTQGRDVALTFDDGPGPYTPAVLSVLEREHVPATFFVIGAELRYFSASTEREIRDGFVIGDHTETHPDAGAPLGARPARRAVRTDRAHRTARRAPARACSARPTGRSTRRPFSCCIRCAC